MPATVRRGVTLVELLVVILIMLMITAISMPVIAPAMNGRDVREAARMIDVFINGARTRAMQVGYSFGVMIERIPGQPNGSVTLSYCEQPDAYTGDYASTVSYPGMPAGSSGSTILLLGNGGFGAWTTSPVTPLTAAVATAPIFPMLDTGWIAGPAPSGAGYLTNIAPGDVMTVNGTQYRIWAGEPFIDIDQNGVCNVTAGFSPDTPNNIQEPFLDVDGNGLWTPPNPAYVDPASGYFIQPNASAGSPFPAITWGQPSAFITYAPFDPVAAATAIGNGNTARNKGMLPYIFGPTTPSTISASLSGNPSFQFSFSRRPIKTSAPSIQLPGESVIDLGANYPDQQYKTIVAIPGSGMEVLVANANGLGWWSTFRANPALDPAIPGSMAQVGSQPSDPTSIMITFQPTGTVDRVYSWSESHETNSTMSIVNWSDWQGRIPAGPIYLLVGRQELIDGDPNLIGRIENGPAPYDPATNTGGPIYNVQDPNALWVVINPLSGAVATAENVGFTLDQVIPTNANWTGQNAMQMQVYWAKNVYYSRRLARAMLDMGGR